jgi:hypothetical protein
MKSTELKLTESQIFKLIDLVQDKIFMLQDINKVEGLEPDEYLKELGNIEVNLFAYQTEKEWNQSLQDTVERLIEESNYGANDIVLSEDMEEWIADQSGLLRNYDTVKEEYTESITEWLFRIYDFFEYNMFEA